MAETTVAARVPYPWPPLPSTNPQEIADDIARSLQDAWDVIEAQRLRVLASVEELARARALTRLAEFEASIAAFQEVVEEEAERFAALMAGEYGAGAIRAATSLGMNVAWTQAHRTAVASLASDSYADLLQRSVQAGRTSAAFAAAVREAARSTVMRTATGGTAVSAGRDLRRALEERGVYSVVYRDGSVHRVSEYAEMAARTKGAVAYNDGSLREYSQLGVGWVEVFDGPACGWASHNDTDLANGTFRTVEDAMSMPISHPNCRRAFGARPDITGSTPAGAQRSSTPSQDEAQARADRERLRPGRPSRAKAADRGLSRREQLAAKRAARTATAPAQPALRGDEA